MQVNEVVVNGVTELSLVNDTVSETSLLENETAHAANGEPIIGKAKYINPNLLDNPDFSINQRGASGTITDTGYFVDRWKLVSGTVTIGTDKTLTLNGTIEQILESAVGSSVTASASAGTASYNNSTKTFTLTASGGKIAWVKLELGSVATPFVPPNPAVELVKCQRDYVLAPLSCVSLVGDINSLIFLLPTPAPMRVVPSLEDPKFRLADAKTNAEIDITDWIFQVIRQFGNGVTIAANKANHGLNVKDCYLEVNTGGLSAEL